VPLALALPRFMALGAVGISPFPARWCAGLFGLPVVRFIAPATRKNSDTQNYKFIFTPRRFANMFYNIFLRFL